jgi:hypothetical protein
VGLTFFLCDERPKATRKTFDLEVASFDTTTGVMAIKMKKGEQKKECRERGGEITMGVGIRQ